MTDAVQIYKPPLKIYKPTRDEILRGLAQKVPDLVRESKPDS